MRRALALLLACFAAGATADPFDVLRNPGEGYARVVPERVIRFPADHLAHPDYRIEWWYLTANLLDEAGRRWGAQWTLFRQSARPGGDLAGWDSSQLWMAHAAISAPDGHRYEHRVARGGIGQAGVELEDGRFSAWLDDWSLAAEGAKPLPARLSFTVDGASVELTLSGDRPYVLQGEAGYSVKSARGQASYYYSQPHIAVDGHIRIDDRTVRVRGQGWLDREWSSQPLADDQPGWDWFALHLADGHALMVYRLRQDDGGHWLSGSWIGPDGSARTLAREEIELTVLERRRVATPSDDDPGATRELPLAWRIRLPAIGREWTLRPLYDGQWLGGRFPYWEGVVLVDGGEGGVGYLELTGYP